MQNQFILTPFFLDRYSALLEEVLQPGWTLNRAELPEAGEQQHKMSAYQHPLADFVAGCAGRGVRPVSVAGDCCTAIAFLAGLQRAGLEPQLIWLDAHGDFNTWETTHSGFLGGMPLAMMVGRGEQTLMQAVGARPLAETDVILCDGRDLDDEERLALAASRVTHLHSPVDLLAHPALDRPLYIHFDVDIINPNDAPAMSYQTPGGPAADELSACFRSLAVTRRIVGVSLSTWNPTLDSDKRSREVCMALLSDLVD